jgi:hypothetical protein
MAPVPAVWRTPIASGGNDRVRVGKSRWCNNRELLQDERRIAGYFD